MCLKKVYISAAPYFPIYLAKNHASEDNLKKAIKTLKKYYISTDREIHMNGLFWHSLLTQYMRDELINHYPEILDNEAVFRNIVLKKFDWENYIYKCVLAAEYIVDSEGNLLPEDKEEQFIHAIFNNLDIYNYIIKYKLFRNRQFIVKFLMMIQENKLSQIMKKKISNHPKLRGDERYGRRVVFELNKSYPILMAPFMEKEELLNKTLEILKEYGAEIDHLGHYE